MDHDEFARSLDAYVDGELELSAALDVERHAQGCAACAALLERREGLRAALRSSGLAYRAPERLRRRVLAAARRADPATTPWRLADRRTWGLSAALAAVLLVATGLPRWRAGAGGARLETELVGAHARSLLAAHLYDVASTDKHTVKPWFAGKLDYSPPVADLAADGFPLKGGRLEYLDGRPTAALVYRRREHAINLFVWPQDAAAPPRARTSRGFHLVLWSEGGMAYAAVSDLNAAELARFVELLRALPPS